MATIECPYTNARDTFACRDHAVFAACDQGSACCFNQTVAGGMIRFITCFNRDAGEATTITERMITDAHDTVWNCDTCKATATIERRIADARDTVRNRDTR